MLKKLNFISIITLFIITSSLLAVDQSEIRKQKKITTFVSLGFPQKSLGAGYNLNGYFTFGLNGGIVNNGKFQSQYQLETINPLTLGYTTQQYKKESSIYEGFVNFFPFKTIPVYLAGYVGKNSGGGESNFNFLPSSTNPFINPLSNYFYYNKTTDSPVYYEKLALGTRYIFENGITLGFEMGGYHKNNQNTKQDININTFSTTNPNTLIWNDLVSKALNYSYYHNTAFINISIGYSF